MIRLTKRGAVLHGPTEVWGGLRQEFHEQHVVRLPRLVSTDLLDWLRRHIDGGEFYDRIHQGIGPNKELCLRHSPATSLLHVLVNNDALFKVIQQIADCGPIGCFQGRVYRVTPGCGHHDAWHSDVGDHRLIAMSLNLSTDIYSGGVLQIRDHQSKRSIAEAPNTGYGDAILFRLSPDLQHRITDVEGAASKTAFAGWFCSEPTFHALLKRHSGGA